MLIRIPNNMGLFKKKTLADKVGEGLRSRLLQGHIMMQLEEKEKEANLDDDLKANKAMETLKTTIRLLREMKRKNDEATKRQNYLLKL